MSIFKPLVSKEGRRRELPANDTIHLPAVQLTDDAIVTINAATGKSFYLDTANSRTLAMSGAGEEMQQILVRIKNTSGVSITPVLDTGSANKGRFGADFTTLPTIAAGKNAYLTFIYNDGDDRWDYLGDTKGF